MYIMVMLTLLHKLLRSVPEKCLNDLCLPTLGIGFKALIFSHPVFQGLMFGPHLQ